MSSSTTPVTFGEDFSQGIEALVNGEVSESKAEFERGNQGSSARRLRIKTGHDSATRRSQYSSNSPRSKFATPGQARHNSFHRSDKDSFYSMKESENNSKADNGTIGGKNTWGDNSWQKNIEELSPDSRELFEDLEEAERGQELINQQKLKSCLPSDTKKGIDFNTLYTPNIASNDHSNSLFSHGSTSMNPMSTDRVFEVASQRLTFSATSASARASFHNDQTPMESLSTMATVSAAASLSTPSNSNATSETGDRLSDGSTEAGERQKTDAELMEESERLARQLMEEEEAQLVERMQQEQMRIISQMRETQREQSRQDGNGDLALALQIADESDEEADLDPDEMSYDALLELGEQIGDVKQERWRIDGQAAVSALKCVTFNPSGGSEIDEDVRFLYEEENPQCVVCQYNFEVNDELKVLPCKHVFHAECIDAWLKDHDTCVVCKRSIVEENSDL